MGVANGENLVFGTPNSTGTSGEKIHRWVNGLHFCGILLPLGNAKLIVQGAFAIGGTIKTVFIKLISGQR